MACATLLVLVEIVRPGHDVTSGIPRLGATSTQRRHKADTPPTHPRNGRSFQEIDVTGVRSHWSRFWARIVMKCVHFLTCLVSECFCDLFVVLSREALVGREFLRSRRINLSTEPRVGLGIPTQTLGKFPHLSESKLNVIVGWPRDVKP